MKLQKQIDEKLKKLYKKFKGDNEDLTGWSFTEDLKKEANFNDELLGYFYYRIVKLSYDTKEIPLLFLKNFILFPFFKEKYLSYPSNINIKNKEIIEIFPKIFFKKGIKTKVLESLDLNKTITAYYYYLICLEKEINEKNYLTEEQINNFSNWENASNEIIKVLDEELNKKFGKNSEVIKEKIITCK